MALRSSYKRFALHCTFVQNLAVFLAAAFSMLHFFTPSTLANVEFSDLTNNSLYDPYIIHFAKQGFVEGYEDLNGKPTGKFGPHDELHRSQMAKVSASVRLAEEKGVVQKWFSKTPAGLSNAIVDLLFPYRSCNGGVCANIGGQPFADVPEKTLNCVQSPSGCQPWYTEFVYFAVHRGYIQGFKGVGAEAPTFKPSEQMIRSHAMKLVMAENGHIDPQQDLRFQRLLFLAQEKGYDSPICLEASIPFMMNHGNDANLIAYALLADQLRLFGDNCEIFTENGEYSAEERADFMQRNITRKEVVRYFGMTTSYAPLYDLSFIPQSSQAPEAEDWMEKDLEELLEDNEEAFINQWLEKEENIDQEENEENQPPEEELPPQLDPESEEFDPEAYLEYLEDKISEAEGEPLEEGGEEAGEEEDPYHPQSQDPYDPNIPDSLKTNKNPDLTNDPSIDLSQNPKKEEVEEFMKKYGPDSGKTVKDNWNNTVGHHALYNKTLYFQDHQGRLFDVAPNTPLKILEENNGYALVHPWGYAAPYRIDCEQIRCTGRLLVNNDLGGRTLGIKVPTRISVVSEEVGLTLRERVTQELKQGLEVRPKNQTIWLCGKDDGLDEPNDPGDLFDCFTVQGKPKMTTARNVFTYKGKYDNGDGIRARTSKDGSTSLWQPVNYDNKVYYALYRDLDYIDPMSSEANDYISDQEAKDKQYHEQRVIDIPAYLDYYYSLGHSLEETRDQGWGKNDKDPKKLKHKKSFEYALVEEWYNEKKAEEEFKIDKTYYVSGDKTSTSHSAPSGVAPVQTVRHKTLPFSIKKMGTAASDKSNGNQTYILVHGEESKPSDWAEVMGHNILTYQNSKGQILILDWSQIVDDLDLDGNSAWITSVMNEMYPALEEWGIDEDKTIIIGHSIGGLFSKELSKKLGDAEFVALDPTRKVRIDFDEEVELLEFGEIPDLSSLFSDTDSNKFQGFDDEGVCFVGSSSLHGSENIIKKCDERYLINFYDSHNHSKIDEVLKDFTINLAYETAGELTKTALHVDADDVSWNQLVDHTVDGSKVTIRATIENEEGEDIFIASATGIIQGKAIDAGCTTVSSGTGFLMPVAKTVCNAAVETAVNQVVESVVNSMNEKKWVPQTYNQMVKYPFNGYILPLGGNRNFSLIDGGWFNIDHHGMVYTEKEDPDRIKYLKTIRPIKSNYYTLYGNAQENTLECVSNSHFRKKECFVYGYRGNDNFKHLSNSLGNIPSNFRIEDFKDNNEADKILIQKLDVDLWGSTHLEVVTGEFDGRTTVGVEVSCGLCSNGYESINKTIYIEGVSFDTVDEWVSVADGSYRETEEGGKLTEKAWRDKQKDNSIQIVD